MSECCTGGQPAKALAPVRRGRRPSGPGSQREHPGPVNTLPRYFEAAQRCVPELWPTSECGLRSHSTGDSVRPSPNSSAGPEGAVRLQETATPDLPEPRGALACAFLSPVHCPNNRTLQRAGAREEPAAKVKGPTLPFPLRALRSILTLRHHISRHSLDCLSCRDI